jgi:hypothetical protein
MSQKLTIFRGDTPSATINLFTQDPTTGLAQVYSIPTSSQIDIHFPGETSTVVLSTTVSGEVTIINAANGQISFAMPQAKSLLLKLGDNQAIDVIVTTPSNVVITAERAKVVKILDRANP